MSDAQHLRAVPLPAGQEPIDLWIADGRVTFRPLAGARELAEPGGFVSAGLVDAHTHLHFVGDPAAKRGREVVDQNRKLHLQRGTLLLRDLGATDDAVLTVRDDDGLPIVRAAGQSLLIEPRAPFFVTAAHELAGAMVRQARAGARWLKVFADWPGWPGKQEEPNFGPADAVTYPTETLASAVAAAHQAGGRVAIHAFGHAAAAAGVAAGVDSIEHGWGIDEALLSVMAEEGIGWCPLLGIAPDMLRSAEQRGAEDQAAWIRATLQRLRTLLPLAHRLGVPILAGTDWFPAVTLADELEQLHRHGLDAVSALAAASSAARSFFNEPDLVEGAPADLVFYRNDPRQDLRRATSPDLVLLRGRPVGVRA